MTSSLASMPFLGAFSAPFMQLTLAASLIAALLCSYFGVFLLLRRTVFVGAALPQLSTAGVALAFLVMGLAFPAHGDTGGLIHLVPAGGAAVLALAGVVAFSLVGSNRRLPLDGLIGAGYVLAAAGTILVLNFIPHDQDEILPLITGNLLTVTSQDLGTLLSTALVIGALLALFFKEFILVAFDPEFARTIGFGTRRWTLFWYLLLAVAVSVTTKVVGINLTFAYLVLPGLTGMVLGRRLRSIIGLALASSALMTVLGLWLSYSLSLPSSPTVTATGAIGLVLAAVWNGFRGRPESGFAGKSDLVEQDTAVFR